jgi:gentisate 1,2-dioxygenase
MTIPSRPCIDRKTSAGCPTAQGQTLPERYLFEELIYVVNGRGATSVWTEDACKQTFEWHQGSMFSPPLNTWRQHFNVQRDEPARFVALTDAPVMINRFRNLDFILTMPSNLRSLQRRHRHDCRGCQQISV